MNKNGNRPFSYYKKESESNDVTMHFEECSNVQNSDRNSYATRSNLAYKFVKNNARSRLFCGIAKRSIVSNTKMILDDFHAQKFQV